MGEKQAYGKFKYIGKWVQPITGENGIDKETDKVRARKIKLAYRLAQN